MLQNATPELTSGSISCTISTQLLVSRTPTAVQGGRPHKNRWGTKDAIPFYLLFHQALREGSPCCEREVGTNAASDQTSHLKGFLTSLASKKGLTMVSFSFFFPCLFLFLKLSLPKLWRKHAPSLLFSPAAPSLHFSVLHRRGLLFSMFGLGHLSV